MLGVQVWRLCPERLCLHVWEQMPRGVPVATVAIGNAANAGLLAARMLAAHEPALLQKMVEYQEGMRTTVLAKAERLESLGWEDY